MSDRAAPARAGDEEEGAARSAAAPAAAARRRPPKREATPRVGEVKNRGRLTVTSATGDEDERTRSVASFRRRVQRMTGHRPVEQKEKIFARWSFPEAITIQELANRMSERAVDVIRILMKQGELQEDQRRHRRRYGAAHRRGDGPHGQARLRGGCRGRPLRRGRRRRSSRAAPAGRDHHGPCRPRQDVAARRHSLRPMSCPARPAASPSISAPIRSRRRSAAR